jgi:hypothetical protein
MVAAQISDSVSNFLLIVFGTSIGQRSNYPPSAQCMAWGV